jgi:hypothetical protein
MLSHKLAKATDGASERKNAPRPNDYRATIDACTRLTVLLTVFLWAASTAVSQAAGHWTCSGSTWIAVGSPQHLTPLKSCGSKLEIPRTQLACENAGGKWGPAGLFPKPICRMPTRDGGRVCADVGECEGLCLAALTPAQRDLLRKHEKLELLGKCTPVSPVFGCMALVKAGVVSGLLCAD